MSDAQAPVPAPGGGETRRVSLFSSRMIVVSAALALVGLALTLAHFIWPTPLMLTLFMILGQGAYGAAIVLYFLVIFVDLRRKKIL
jgi:hypothetical protein